MKLRCCWKINPIMVNYRNKFTCQEERKPDTLLAMFPNLAYLLVYR